jgi:hypothetical protein
MREKLSVFYYPSAEPNETTLKKAILLFDELHIMDEPAFSFVKAGCGFIGMSSALRGYEKLFREQGFPLYVHYAPNVAIQEFGGRYKQVVEDINDLEFLRRFQRGLKTSKTFRDLNIKPGNYGKGGDHNEVARKLITVDLDSALKIYGRPLALFEDASISTLDYSNNLDCSKNLIFQAVGCSAKLNYALDKGTSEGFIPLADASPYGDLLGAKYARAINKLQVSTNQIQLTDLGFAIFDELLPTERLDKLEIPDVIHYRKASEKAREAFLEHLVVLQTKQGNIGPDGDYTRAVQKVVITEILPAARTFKNKLEAIWDNLFGKLATGVVTALGGASTVELFFNLSWDKLLLLAGPAGAYIIKETLDSFITERSARRECSISYLLSLDK